QVVLQLRALNSPACTPNRPDRSATVPSSRTAASATFALNSGLCFFRVLVMSHLRPPGRSKGRLSLSDLSSFRGPPHRNRIQHLDEDIFTGANCVEGYPVLGLVSWADGRALGGHIRYSISS